MQFGAAGFRLLYEIVRADPALGPVKMAKTDLSDAYMRVCLSLVDAPRLAFVIPSFPGEDDILIGFHLSLPIGFVDSCLNFCMVKETIADIYNNADKTTQPVHPL